MKAGRLKVTAATAPPGPHAAAPVPARSRHRAGNTPQPLRGRKSAAAASPASPLTPGAMILTGPADAGTFPPAPAASPKWRNV